MQKQKKKVDERLNKNNKVFLNIYWSFFGLIGIVILGAIVGGIILAVNVINMPVQVLIDCGGGITARVDGSLDFQHRTIKYEKKPMIISYKDTNNQTFHNMDIDTFPGTDINILDSGD